ncbi:ATP-binding protein [Mycolicibacterium sp. P9-64]|uniref:AAA family ATPase n=1 Tax=Mycolicibacterium sp. P9-64 TaxID=2024612 RepID=UPI0011ED857C|nr:AAA family ATPase [Mycolicibacterium sp. P9-64]KAA0080740.1 ATP-binding protein [Mycolicibacterium sp. P9-64]
MPVEWVTAPEEPLLGQLEAAVRSRSGALLVGPAGVGKTSLARAAVAKLAGEFDRAATVTGTVAWSAVPFAAFGDLIEIADAGKTAAVLRTARESIGDGVLLLVDDAHALDRLSAALVYQLGISGAARLILVVDADESMPDGLSTLVRDQLVAQIDVAPTGYDARALDEQVSSFVAGLPAAATAVLEFVALSEPLSVAVLGDLVGADAVSAAATAGAVVIDGDDVRPAHPVFARAARIRLDPERERRLRTELVEKLPASTNVVERLKRAVLALHSDSPLPVTDLVTLADEALRLGDLQLSERFGRAALADGGLAARLPLAYALAWQGRGRDADAVLADVDPAALTETELMAWALPRAANQFWMLSEPERATAFLQSTRNQVTTPTARTTLDALSATFAMNAGSPSRAMQVASEVLASPDADDTAIGWASAAAALSSARMGLFADVDSLAERAVTAGHPGLLRFTSGFGQTTARLLDGRLDDAHALARQLLDFTQSQQPGRAIGEVLVADVLMARGELDEAIALLRGAAAALAPTGYSWGPLAWMMLAQALGQKGQTAEAGRTLARAEARHGLKSMLFAPELSLAKAWTCASRRDGHGAINAAREAARAAERGGQSAVALRALHDAVRLGDVRAADGIARLSLDCTVGRLALDHGRALAAGDAAALDSVAEAFAGIGMRGAASDAAAQADRARK